MHIVSRTPERTFRLAITIERRDALTRFLELAHSEWRRTGDHFAFNDMMLAFAGKKQLDFVAVAAND